jgi:hypothetical protein
MLELIYMLPYSSVGPQVKKEGFLNLSRLWLLTHPLTDK